MGRPISDNVGLPRDVPWRGETVYTGIWKHSVRGRVVVRKLNVAGDGQGDLAGHGGEHRAVMVYQTDSYHYWEAQLGRSDFTFGQFGENLTVDGLSDDEVCIGDRYRIGGARDGNEHPFAKESRELLQALTRGQSRVVYGQPEPGGSARKRLRFGRTSRRDPARPAGRGSQP